MGGTGGGTAGRPARAARAAARPARPARPAARRARAARPAARRATGTAAVGGATTDGGTAAAFSYTFDTTSQGFGFKTFRSAGHLATDEAGTPATFGWDSTTAIRAPARSR